MGMGCSGRSFAVEGPRRGKPLKSFEVFRLWEWDVVAGEGPRRGKPLKSRVANFSFQKGLYF